MSLADYLERHLGLSDDGNGESGDLPYYAGNTPLRRSDFEALGLHYPDVFDDGEWFNDPRLWIGPKGSLTPLHYDGADNVICQYVGRKYLRLFPPSQIRWLYTTRGIPAWSGIADPRAPDLVKYPLFAKARSVDVTLHPGETLYLPARWAHFALNLDSSVMVNFWHRPTRYRVLQSRTTRLRWRVQEWIGL